MKRAGLIFTLLLSLGLTACAKDVPFATLEGKYANPQSKFMVLPTGERVHYRDEGKADGQAIVLVHGFSASLHTWEPWVQRLSPDYRVISLDLAAHGLTQVPEGYVVTQDAQSAIVDGVTRKLGVDHFVLAGNSMGGGVSWNYALKHPERLDGLVLVDSVGLPPPETGKAREGGPFVFKMLRNPVGQFILRRVNPKPVAEPGLKKAYHNEALVTPEVLDRYVNMALAPGRREMILSMQNQSRTPVTPETFKAIKTPTLVMHGDADALISIEAGRALAAAIPGAKLIVYPNVGHIPMEEVPDQSAADLKAFIAALPPRAETTK